VAIWAAIFLSVTEAIIVSVTLFCCRYVLGYAYSSEKQVVNYIAVMAPLICVSIVMDGLQAVLSGSLLTFLSFKYRIAIVFGSVTMELRTIKEITSKCQNFSRWKG
jgi:uncharacterized membrane protein